MRDYKSVMNEITQLLLEAAEMAKLVILVEESRRGVIFGDPDFINSLMYDGDENYIHGFRAYGRTAALEDVHFPEGKTSSAPHSPLKLGEEDGEGNEDYAKIMNSLKKSSSTNLN
jgi:hypothetical protein